MDSSPSSLPAERASSSPGTRQPLGAGGFRPALLQATRAELMARIIALEGQLASMPAIEQAKGALMATYGITADAAFALLRFHSQNRNVKVRAIAAQLTALMSSSPSSTDAILQFDQLLDQVSKSLQPPDQAVRNGGSANPASTATTIIQAPGNDPGDLDEVMLRSVATVPPGITIAAYAPGMPLVYANQAFTEITGYPMTGVLGRNCQFLQGPETDPHTINTLRGALDNGQETSVILRNYRSDGTAFWNEVSISPLRDRTGTITHYVGTQIDVTAHTHRPSPDATTA